MTSLDTSERDAQPITMADLPYSATPNLDAMEALQRELADEYARVTIETKARYCESNFPAPVYDITALEDTRIDDPEQVSGDIEELQRAVRYLDLRGALVRPIAAHPEFVSFGRAA